MTERITLDDMQFDTLTTEEDIEQLFEGASDLIPGQEKESPVVEQTFPQNDDGTSLEVPEDKVILINVKYPQQSFGIYENGRYTGNQVTFQDGLLVCDRDTANWIKALAPHVHEEPREGHVFGPFAPTGFKTRNPEAYDEHMSSYYRNL